MYKRFVPEPVEIVATVISTRILGYVIDVVTDGEWYHGAYYLHRGHCEFVPDTGTRDIADTIEAIEDRLGAPK